MKAASPSVTLLQRRARALIDALPGAIAGDAAALHRARVASTAAPRGAARRRGRRLRRGTAQSVGSWPAASRARWAPFASWTSRCKSSKSAPRPTTGTGRPSIGRAAWCGSSANGAARTCSAGCPASTPTSSSDGSPRSPRRSRPPANDPWRRALAARLAHRARRLHQAIGRAGSIYVPFRLHAVRIAAKQLRYTLELAVEVGLPDVRPHVSTVKRAQTTLGRLQDLQVVLRQVDAASAEPGLEPAARAGLARLAQVDRRRRASRARTLPAIGRPGCRRSARRRGVRSCRRWRPPGGGSALPMKGPRRPAAQKRHA